MCVQYNESIVKKLYFKDLIISLVCMLYYGDENNGDKNCEKLKNIA